MTNDKGFSIVEMVVAMAIFIGLMLIVSSTFENILRTGGQQMRSAETNTEGIVGLEMLRGDLEHAGFGLPWTYPDTPNPNPPIDETSAGAALTGITPSLLSSFDETTAPRAIMVGAASSGVKYLVVKSNRVALNEVGQKWAYVNYSSTTSGTNMSHIKQWNNPNNPGDDFSTNDRVITINSTFTDGEPSKTLVMATSGSPNYYYPIPGTTPIVAPSAYQPGDASQLYVVYGVDSGGLRMPYNRADYYVQRPAVGFESCNSGTGILYKGVVKHDDGTFIPYPLLNCVGDMQVEFELDYDNDGNISYSPALNVKNGATPMTAAEIRSQLKNIRVYILAHEGKKDRNYSYPNDTIQVGDAERPSSSGRTWSGAASCTTDCMQTVFGADWRNYRWKVYTIVVRPKNLN